MRGVSRPLPRRSRHTSSPLILGNMISRRIKSGSSVIALSSPSLPSRATRTLYPSYSKLSLRPRTMSGSSSIIKIVCNPVPSAPLIFRNLQNRFFGQGDREPDSKLAPFARGALNDDFSLMRLDDVLDQSQSEAASLSVVNEPAAHSVELLEDLLLFPSRDTYSVIGNPDCYIAVRRPG